MSRPDNVREFDPKRFAEIRRKTLVKLWDGIRAELRRIRPDATEAQIAAFIREIEEIYERIFGPPKVHELMWYNPTFAFCRCSGWKHKLWWDENHDDVARRYDRHIAAAEKEAIRHGR